MRRAGFGGPRGLVIRRILVELCDRRRRDHAY
jgi:hypothetical protein